MALHHHPLKIQTNKQTNENPKTPNKQTNKKQTQKIIPFALDIFISILLN
jgi:hypothetical protein